MKFKPWSISFALACLFLILSNWGGAKTLQLYILTGQSNSLGAVKGSPASPELLNQYKSNGSTKFWHTNFNKTTGKPVDFNPPPSTTWGTIVPQRCGSASSSFNCMGPEYGFAAIMERKKWKLAPIGKKTIDIGIVKASLDGGGKNHWYKDTPSYKTIIKTANTAIAKAIADGYDKVQVVGVIYLQGESNSNDEHVKEDFLAFLNNLESDISSSGADTSLLKKQQAILGEHALWASSNKTNPETGDITAGDNGNTSKAGKTSDLQKALAESRKNMGWVPTRDLTKITSGDNAGVHYDGKSQITIGARYAYEAARLAGYDTGCVRNGNIAAPLCSPTAWTNRKLPLKSVAIWDVASSAKDNMTGTSPKEKAALYGIKIEDPFLNTITIRGIMAGSAPSLKCSYLALGKGGIEISNNKNLHISSVLLVAGNQTWKLSQGCSLRISSSDQSKSKGTLITGTGNINMDISQKINNTSAKQTTVTIDLASSSANKPYSGNWEIAPSIHLHVNGEESPTPTVLLDHLVLGLNKSMAQPQSKEPILTISGSNFLIRKGIVLNISSDLDKTAPVSFCIINPDNNKLIKTLSKEKISLSPQSKGWEIDSFDTSTGTLTLSPTGQP